MAQLPYQLHQKLRQSQQNSSPNLSVLRGLPFWIWDKELHRQQAANGNCCFNHVCGLPTKDSKQYPLFDHEKILYDSLMSIEGSFNEKHLGVRNATGLEVTEFMLRIMAWLCTKETRNNQQMCIVTGPYIDMAIN